MAQDHGVFDDIVPDAPVLPVVDVGAADAGVVYLEEDGVRVGDGRDGAVFEGYGFRAAEDEGVVLLREGGWVSLCEGFGG